MRAAKRMWVDGPGTARSRRWRVAPAATLAVFCAAAPATAQPERGGAPVTFDVPEQPLDQALERYGDVSGREVLYGTGLTAGRRSSAVRGTMPPDEALRKLLEGTGLAARFLPDGSFVLEVSKAARPAPDTGVRTRYYARIQAGVREALCASGARPGSYRVAALLWIGPSGAVVRHARLSSTGTPDLDRGIDRTLGRLAVGAPPPGFAQPVLVMVMPEAPDVTMGCPAGPRRAGGLP